MICIEFQRTKDLSDAWQMLAAARREPTAIDPKHLDDLEMELQSAALKKSATPPPQKP